MSLPVRQTGTVESDSDVAPRGTAKRVTEPPDGHRAMTDLARAEREAAVGLTITAANNNTIVRDFVTASQRTPGGRGPPRGLGQLHEP